MYTALHADRLAHRRRLAVIAEYFEHALRLPQSFHVGTHSGRVLKVMLDGAHGMWSFWLSLFRTHFAALVTVLVLLPLTLFIELRMGMMLVALVTIFGAVTTVVVRRTDKLQRTVEEVHTELAERAADSISNIAVVQSFAARRSRSRRPSRDDRALPSRADPGAVLVGGRLGGHPDVFHADRPGHLLARRRSARPRRGHRGADHHVHDLLGRAHRAARAGRELLQPLSLSQAPKIRQFFDVVDTIPAVRDAAGARHVGRVGGAIRFEDVTFSYDGERPAVRGRGVRDCG